MFVPGAGKERVNLNFREDANPRIRHESGYLDATQKISNRPVRITLSTDANEAQAREVPIDSFEHDPAEESRIIGPGDRRRTEAITRKRLTLVMAPNVNTTTVISVTPATPTLTGL